MKTEFLNPPHTGMQILSDLRQTTADLHAEVETLLNLTREDVTRLEYQQLLLHFYGFYAPAESKLAALSFWQEQGFDMKARLKVPHLLTDLHELGVTQAQIAHSPLCLQYLVIDSYERALGNLYVMEGATLGAQILTKHFERILGLTPQSGGRFFFGYGPQTGNFWQNFQSVVVKAASDSQRAQMITTAAYETFYCFNMWMKERMESHAGL